ncbi:hypothetical protein MPSEU_000935000 [Mayamaea pseudoterrestris]|nr:hypothetical protein MPSEU_000935000 [Mayamaea pseudoterrestris]
MKFSAALILAMSAGASAFTSQSMSKNQALRMTDITPKNEETTLPEELVPVAPKMQEPTKVSLLCMSESLPFMERQAALDAMLAAAGWPLSKLWDKKIAVALGLTPVVGVDGRAPSLLNGGLGKVSPIIYWIVVLTVAAAIDVYGISKAKSNNPSYFAGNLSFDPLGLYLKETEGQKRMQLAELKNGRLAMIAITAFAVQEKVTSLSVVKETPVFFKPLGEALHESANAGYYIP